MWTKLKTEGQILSEGIVLLDEESDMGARITLEKGGMTAPWSITCGIYGTMAHTAFAPKKAEALDKYDKMKIELEKLILLWDEDRELFYKAVEEFTQKYI